jgi:hypothetical protein
MAIFMPRYALETSTVQSVLIYIYNHQTPNQYAVYFPFIDKDIFGTEKVMFPPVA